MASSQTEPETHFTVEQDGTVKQNRPWKRAATKASGTVDDVRQMIAAQGPLNTCSSPACVASRDALLRRATEQAERYQARLNAQVEAIGRLQAALAAAESDLDKCRGSL